MTAEPSLPIAPIHIAVESGLTSPGDTIEVSDRVELARLVLGGRDFDFEDGLFYDVALTNTGEGILAAGTVRGCATTQCDRCLGPARLDISAEVSCYYLREEPEDEADDEQDFGLIDQVNGRIDLTDAVLAAVYGDMPFVVLCDEDCKGLCPSCGQNLNEGECSCGERVLDRPSKSNPFAVLSTLDFGDA